MMDGLTKIKFWADESGRSGSLRLGALSGWRLGAALVLLLVLLAIGAVAGPWRLGGADGPPPGFISGNGRTEAIEIDVATRLPGHLAEVLVDEGDMGGAALP